MRAAAVSSQEDSIASRVGKGDYLGVVVLLVGVTLDGVGVTTGLLLVAGDALGLEVAVVWAGLALAVVLGGVAVLTLGAAVVGSGFVGLTFWGALGVGFCDLTVVAARWSALPLSKASGALKVAF